MSKKILIFWSLVMFLLLIWCRNSLWTGFPIGVCLLDKMEKQELVEEHLIPLSGQRGIFVDSYVAGYSRGDSLWLINSISGLCDVIHRISRLERLLDSLVLVPKQFMDMTEEAHRLVMEHEYKLEMIEIKSGCTAGRDVDSIYEEE